MTLLLLYLFLALFVSGLCSIMESVLLSTPKAFLMVKEEKGNAWATSFLNLKTNVDKPLSAILSLNTIAHTIGAAGVGAQAVKVFGEEYFGLVSAILTILILIVTEIIPKTIGARYWRKLAKATSKIIGVMIIITYPLVWLSAFITKLFSKNAHSSSTSREEISALASLGADEGVFNEKEHKIIQNLLRLKNVFVTEIMTPRIVVEKADDTMTLQDFFENKDLLRFSRIPVYHESEENITGYVFRQEVFEKIAEGESELQLKSISRPIVTVSNNKTLFRVWETLLEKREHIALIRDEFGGMEGIVTLEDVIETLLGLEIVDEKDTVDDMQEYARKRWKQRQAKYNQIKNLKKKNDESSPAN
ncbi:CBS domain containing-hemolysin-like protein [Balneicella halophila]|uniref:CBS domain containing-hemolysin-like protein n=1 Tax=Balneicella halophila TaxID=1537566 RepID=A0A7L4UN64_BALHA|nr:hemolysin family protein [Balneicella halophila]PVX49915.1 CBS domain containing-hemolysin-like protein [Balneicella halophila]